jgi:hypothetical protein
MGGVGATGRMQAAMERVNKMGRRKRIVMVNLKIISVGYKVT